MDKISLDNVELELNGVLYIRKDAIQSNELAEDNDNMPFVMIRSYRAGVFFGYLKEEKNNGNRLDVILLKSRRVYYWDGASSLSELATKGTSAPNNCKFPCPIQGEHTIINVIELIPITKIAKKSLEEVSVWTQH